MSANGSNETTMINVQIDGEWRQFPKGTRLIEACMQSGHFVPHYCYHPALTSPGNCRMCLLEIGSPKTDANRQPVLGPDGRPEIAWNPRPQISCALEISEGMAVKTDSPLVEDCRKGVMEFLLINHPLDCPICDKAGECRLQEFAVEFGQGGSNFLEEKVKKPKQQDIGRHIVLDDERCILCSRCIRFMQEVAHDDVLGFVDRGSHTKLTVHEGQRLDSNYSLNTVDICPVGALTSKDFRFKMRVWFLRETKSICTSCGTGCNTVIGARENQIVRQTPRQNDAVNSYWMCDHGRLNYGYLYREDRLVQPQLRENGRLQKSTWPRVIQQVAEKLSAIPRGEIAMLASARMTNEELWLAGKIARHLGITLHEIVPRPQEADGILVCNDGNPNTRGAELLGITRNPPGTKAHEIATAVRNGKVKALLCLGEDPRHLGLSEHEIASVSQLICLDILPNTATKHAAAILPGAGFAEKRGSMVNVKDRIQRLNCAVQPPGQARDDWEILADLLRALDGEAPQTLESVFKEMSSAVPALAGLTLAGLGDSGIVLKTAATLT
ncbi:MAG: 2Fe-2S iron-sulfur cluster binding domain-containing protein [Chthoniobacterales bacterium]|nr:2Fe-2S iron-sulfur cluster binding domain-containing protein [Chthoniobacterales bacterium]